MFAISDNDRRAGSGPGKVTRDVPVLFHLLDVSPRPPQTPTASPPPRLEPEAEEKSGAPACCEDTGGSDRSATSEHAAQCTPPARSMSPPVTLPAPTALPAPAITSPASAMTALAIEIPVVPAATPQQHPPAECQPSTPSAASDTDHSRSAGAPATTSDVTATESAAVASPAAASRESVTLRQRTRPPASEDWLASHGKFIALGFLLALGATIYLARTRRQHGPAEMAQTTSPAPLIDEPPTISVPSATPTTATRVLTTPTPLIETSPANLVETASATSESKAELHPPAAPPLLAPAVADAKGSTATSSSSKDNLFDFAATSKTDVRIASLSNRASSTSAETTPAGTVVGTPTAPQPTAPELSPAYPTTSTPMPAYPVTTSVPVAYPTTQAPSAPAPAAPPAASSPYSSFPPGTVAVTSGYGAAPPQAALPQPGMAPAPASAGVNYRSAYAPAMPGAAPQGAAPTATTWTPAAPGGMVPPQYPPTTNTATGPRYERTGSGNY